MEKVLVVAECGINHNGNLDIAKRLVDAAKDAGCDAVKFQKRNIDKVYSTEELAKYRESPWGTTNRQQKEGLEFGRVEYDEIDWYCKSLNIPWFASAWDLDSVEFLKQYDCPYNKIASPMLTHMELLHAVAKQGKLTFIGTGMSGEGEIFNAVEVFHEYNTPFVLMHCNSQYPMPDDRANLLYMRLLGHQHDCPVGYSGHEVGLITSVLAVALGASVIERHITLDRAMYGSDQAASVEPQGFKKLVEYIRVAERAMGDGVKVITPEELICQKKLRRTKDY